MGYAVDSRLSVPRQLPTELLNFLTHLNLDVEKEAMTLAVTDEDIVLAVHLARSQAEDDGADDTGEDPIPPVPTQKEILLAAEVLLRAAASSNGSAARKPEDALAAFSRERRAVLQASLVPTYITDYFAL